MTRRAVWLAPALAICAAGACDGGPDGGGPSTAATSTSGSVLLDADGARGWVASPDDDALVAFDASSLEEVGRVALAGEPEQLARVGASLVVTLRQAASVAVVRPAQPVEASSVTMVDVPCGGTRAVVSASATRALVTCPNDDRVVELDLDAGRVVRVLALPGRPSALAVAGELLYVTTGSGAVHALSLGRIAALGEGASPAALVAIESFALEAGTGRAATEVDSLAVAPTGAAFAAFQRVDQAPDRSRPEAQGGYGSVVDGNPRLEPLLFASCGSRYARFDGGSRVYNGPSAVAFAPATSTLWVTHLYTDDVAVIACPAVAPTPSGPLSSLGASVASPREARVLATFRVGRAPRGITVAADGRTAFVDVGFDHAIARLELPASGLDGAVTPLLDAAAERRRAFVSARLSDAALRGRSLFFDGVNTHLTPSGIVTCGSCHPGGGDDGLSWFLHTEHVGPKVRRTPPAWGARPELSPFHWDGEFTDASLLAHTGIVELMGGDGLLVDTAAIAAWMAEARPPPARAQSADEVAAAARGRTLFESSAVGCATCHAGATTSDGASHAVVPEVSDAAANMLTVETPTLRAVRARAPYLHDGRAATLRDVLTVQNPTDSHGRASTLAPSELDDLVSYLESL